MSTPWPNLAALGRDLSRGFVQLVYPNTCWVCANFMPEPRAQVCNACLPRLTHDPFPTCPRCSSTVGPHVALEDGCPECRGESFAFDGAFRMAPYEGVLREVVLRMKHRTGEDLAEVVAALWAQEMAPRLAPLGPDVVVPIPLHWLRRWRRGFNQSEILAAALSKQLARPCWKRALCRARWTEMQTAQPSGAARRENVKHAFEARRGKELQGKSILLVDDVLTTGATVNEAARALAVHKPRSIHVAMLAHGQ